MNLLLSLCSRLSRIDRSLHALEKEEVAQEDTSEEKVSQSPVHLACKYTDWPHKHHLVVLGLLLLHLHLILKPFQGPVQMSVSTSCSHACLSSVG